jgi:3-hydroxyacyl-[acyl-carrier-protein] dehydratase
MLLVDRVTDIVPGKHLTAIKAVTASEPWFRMSPPTDDCFPTVLLMESLCQAAVLLAVWDMPDSAVPHSKTMLLGSISDVVVHAPVRPGSIIQHHVRLCRDLGDSFLLDGESTVGGRPVLEIGQVLVALRPTAALNVPVVAPYGVR